MTRTEEIKERLGKATPGEWYSIQMVDDIPGTAFIKQKNSNILIAEVPGAKYQDANFIAHAPSNIQFLLEENERLRGLVKRYGYHYKGTEIEGGACELYFGRHVCTCGYAEIEKELLPAPKTQGEIPQAREAEEVKKEE